MAIASPFDALAVVADLESAGMERRQAEAVAKAAVQAVTAGSGEFVTRADLAALEERLEARLEARLANLEARLEAARARGEARVYLALVAFAVAIVGAVKLLP